MSEFVVHFTKDGPPRDVAYENMLSILSEGVLRPGPSPFGCARRDFHAQESQFCTCFSEVPVDMLTRLVARRSKHGIGFRKSYLLARGGAPVWYVDYNGPLHQAVEELKVEANAVASPSSHPLWKLTPFIDVVARAGSGAPYTYDFTWEREWRVAGPVSFEPDDVAFLFIPAEDHDAARSFFDSVERDELGPAYRCAFLDPLWTPEEIQRTLS